jgi:shikimate kinase
MTRILLTGMSGVGKSTLVAALAERGHHAVDTDGDAWSRWETLADGLRDWVWREDAITHLLAEADGRTLFLAGCKSNQGRFYAQLDAVVLLTAPLAVLLRRIATRSGNPYGKSDEERALVVCHVETVEPLLRRTATHVLDATAPVAALVEQLEAIASACGAHAERLQGREARPTARGS